MKEIAIKARKLLEEMYGISLDTAMDIDNIRKRLLNLKNKIYEYIN